MKVLVTTYNAAAKVPIKGEDLTPLLALDQHPDIISMGFEEIGDSDAWEDEVDKLLENHGYYRVKLETMWAIQIVVFAKKQHLPFISHIESVETKTGMGGLTANKGATTIRFRLYDRTVAIVNSHLAAHKDEVSARNTDYWSIMRDQEFRDTAAKNLCDHDFLIWAGDLNYRVEHENVAVRRMISEGKHLDLLQHDQLLREIRNRKAFVGFHEAAITFKPTFKFDEETGLYETTKNRTPSWCDRVLWRSKEEQVEVGRLINWELWCAEEDGEARLHRADVDDTVQFLNLVETLEPAKLDQVAKNHEDKVKPIFYNSYPEFLLSDHKPVSCMLDLAIDTDLVPFVEFTKSQFTDMKRKHLEVKFQINDGYPASSYDWIALVNSTWTDANKHKITWEWVPSGTSKTVKFSDDIPDGGKDLQVVYVSDKLGAPVAIADIC